MKDRRFGTYRLVANAVVYNPGLQHSSHQELFSVSDGVRSLTDPEQGVLQQCVGSPIIWLCPGLPPGLPTDRHTFLPKHLERETFIGLSRVKITRIVASLTAYRSARSKVQQCCCPAFRKHRALGRFEVQEALCLWVRFTAALCVLASAGFVLLPHLSLSPQFERSHPVFIRVHIRALTLLEERQL